MERAGKGSSLQAPKPTGTPARFAIHFVDGGSRRGGVADRRESPVEMRVPASRRDKLGHPRQSMTVSSKPPRTGNHHTLPFDKLSPVDFERLCLWLVRREGFEQAEHLGEAGGEGGRDVVAWKDGRRVVFPCKRARAFTAAHAKKEIAKLRELPAEDQPHELVFVVSQAVSAAARGAARRAWGDSESCQFWAGGELDERVKRHEDLVAEFFQLAGEPARRAFLHNLPFPSLGEFFQGRGAVLDRLRQSLCAAPAGRATAIAGKAVHGLGGVGKSRLAVEYAWRYAGEYGALFFLGAATPELLRRNLAALCGPALLNLPEYAAREEEVREAAALRRLREQSGWLLILDNVDTEEAAEAVDALLPRLQGGHVLLTGRLARWGAEVEVLELDVLEEGDAVSFLLARTETRRRTAPDDERQAHTLAQELGCLPLALEQAGAFIAERRLTFAAYLATWREKREKVLTWFDPRVSHYPASVATTWQTSFDRLSEPARRLLERLAWLAPEPIPERLLDVPRPDLSEPEPDPHESLVELETYSLVSRAKEAPTFAVHRLVQDVTRRRLTGKAPLRSAEGAAPPQPGATPQAGSSQGHGDSDVWSNAGPVPSLLEALRWVNAAFAGDPQDVRTRPTLEPLVPHARAVTARADAAGIAEPTARLLNQVAQLLHAKALYADAELLMRRALLILLDFTRRTGHEHPNLQVVRKNYRALLAAMGQPEAEIEARLAQLEASTTPPTG